ncbi:MAG: hypothetical protein U7M05_01525 [Candidatus Igneacidithiobacillus chanchocoensis]
MRWQIFSLVLLGGLLHCPPLWAADLPFWQLPEELHSTPIADEIWLNGVPIRIALLSGVVSEATFHNVAERNCEKGGGRFGENQLGAKKVWSCIREPYSQTIQWQREGGRIQGEISTLRLDATPLPSQPVLPTPALTQMVSNMESRDGSIKSQVEMLQSGLNIPQLRAALLREARASGWKIDTALSATLQRMSLQKRGQLLDIAFAPQPMGGSRAVVVWQEGR